MRIWKTPLDLGPAGAQRGVHDGLIKLVFHADSSGHLLD
jgi:hypothetical protein